MTFQLEPPKVSIVTPTFNRPELLEATIRSVQNQTYQRWELLLIDDGSNNTTWLRMEELERSDSRIRAVLKDPVTRSKGPQDSRNLGMEFATGELMVFMDSDDEILPHCLEQRVCYMLRNRETEMAIFPGFRFFCETGEKEVVGKCSVDDDTTPVDLFFGAGDRWVNLNPIWRTNAVRDKQLRWDIEALRLQDQFFHLQALARGITPVFVNEAAEDFHWNFHAGDRVSRQHTSKRVASSEATMFIKTLFELKGGGRVTGTARKGISKAILSCAARFVDNDDCLGGYRLWKRAHDEKAVSLIRYLMGVVQLAGYKIRHSGSSAGV